MNSDKKPNNIKTLLDASSARISPDTSAKLRAARTFALQHQRTHRAPVVSWVYAHTGLPLFNPLARPANLTFAGLLLAVLLASGYSVMQNYIAEREISDVDIAILTDDLPLHVFVD